VLLKQKKLNGDNHLFTHFTVMVRLQEGQNWEAIMYVPKSEQSYFTIDLNGKQIDGSTDEVLANGKYPCFEAFDWDV
jgi:transketolase